MYVEGAPAAMTAAIASNVVVGEKGWSSERWPRGVFSPGPDLPVRAVLLLLLLRRLSAKGGEGQDLILCKLQVETRRLSKGTCKSRTRVNLF